MEDGREIWSLFEALTDQALAEGDPERLIETLQKRVALVDQLMMLDENIGGKAQELLIKEKKIIDRIQKELSHRKDLLEGFIHNRCSTDQYKRKTGPLSKGPAFIDKNV